MKASPGPDKQKVNDKMNKRTPVTQTKQIEGLQCQQFLATVWLEIMVVTLSQYTGLCFGIILRLT